MIRIGSGLETTGQGFDFRAPRLGPCRRHQPKSQAAPGGISEILHILAISEAVKFGAGGRHICLLGPEGHFP